MNRALMSVIGMSTLLLVFVAQSELVNVNAQQLTKLKKILEDKFPGFVKVNYESPTTIVISENLIINGFFNTKLWVASDMLKTQYGFKLQQVFISGVGSEENPTVVYIIMTK